MQASPKSANDVAYAKVSGLGRILFIFQVLTRGARRPPKSSKHDAKTLLRGTTKFAARCADEKNGANFG